MKNYRVYGNEKTHLVLSAMAYIGYNELDPIEIREYESVMEDAAGNIVTDEAGDAVKEYSYSVHGCLERQCLTGKEVNELFEGMLGENQNG